jgi:serine/threonine protein kinase
MKSSTSICCVDEGVASNPRSTHQSSFPDESIVNAPGLKNNQVSSHLTPAFISMSNELQVGQVLDDRFKILDLINRGGMACIYEALDCETGRPVALKVPFMQYESDPGFFCRFQREENIGLTLDHPNIVKILPAADKSRLYIVMEYLEGQTLAASLRERAPLSENESVRIASQICEGLDYLHRKGVVHRDLKPENVMLCKNGAVRIMDFGIAKSENARRLTFGGFSGTMGTPDYIAPEQVQGKRGDSRTDIYALGAMLYEMTTGFTPYDGDNPFVVMNARLTGDPDAPRQRNPQLSPAIEEIILHAIERHPSNRFSSAGAMKAELNNYDEVHLTERSKRLRPPQLWRARMPLLPKIVALVVIQIAAFFLVFWWLSHRSHHSSSGMTKPEIIDTRPQGK